MDKNLNDINNEKKLNVQEEQIKDAAESAAGYTGTPCRGIF